MTLRIRPIAPRPVRTVNEYRKREADRKYAEKLEQLRREVQEKGKSNERSC